MYGENMRWYISKIYILFHPHTSTVQTRRFITCELKNDERKMADFHEDLINSPKLIDRTDASDLPGGHPCFADLRKKKMPEENG